MKVAGAYAIIHRKSGRAYVGSSRHVFGRWKTHAYRLAHGRHHASELQILWRQDGADAFAFIVLEECHIEDLPLVEQKWLDAFESPLNASPNAWNPNLDPVIAARGAAKRVGQVRSDATRTKLRAVALASWARGDHPRTVPEELKQRRLQGLRRLWSGPRSVAPETRAKISATLRGNVHHDAETRAKISAGTRSALARPEVKAQLSDARHAAWITRRTG